MINVQVRFVLTLIAIASWRGVMAAEPTVTSNDLPRIPAVEAKDALKTFEVKKGFHVEMVASEPNIASPVAVSFDENGRMYVVEMIDYSERRDETPHLGRIRLLEDTDGDGVYDKSTVFADNLAWPTAVFCYQGGVFVGATPDIIYLKDTNGDGKADIRETVFTGFSEGVKRINVQAMLNSFIWGLDNRIHGATSGNGGMIKMLKHPNQTPVDLHGRDFVINPADLTMRSEAGGGQHGLSFDDRGRRFACNNSDHIRLFMYDDRYASRNSFYTMPANLQSIAVDGPAAEVYRISPEEPWRVIRTRWRVAGLVSGPIEGGGRSAGYFTGATGNTIYRGNAYPLEYLDNAFVGDAGGNLVHRKVLIPDGVELKAQRGPGEEKSEFLASRDTWFRPVQFANAPDGTLYVIDMYRETIEHPWSLPDNIKKFLDLNSGNNRGRIYRIAPDGFKQPRLPHLGQATAAELVAALEHPNGWHRDTASRLLFERQDKAAVPLLTRSLEKSKSPLGRLHSLSALEGLHALKESHILIGLSDADDAVREHAVKLSESFFREGKAAAKLFKKLDGLASDPSILVRYQLAFTLGQLKEEKRIQTMAAIARKDMESTWVQAALLSSLAEGAGALFEILSADDSFSRNPRGREMLRQLAALTGARNNRAEVAEVLNFISRAADPEVSFSLTRALSDGLARGGSSLAASGSDINSVIARAKQTALDHNSPEAVRVEAVQLLSISAFDQTGPQIASLLNLAEPQAVQSAAISTLARFSSPEVGAILARHLNGLTPRLRSEAMAVLLARPERATELLQAIEAGTLRPTALDTTQTRFLRNHRDPSVKQLAAKVLGVQKVSSRQQVIDAFMPAVDLKGDPVHGKKIYQERCISCHRIGGEGFALGPDLVTVKNSGKDKMLVNILDPSREVRPDLVSYEVDTKDDESYIGLIANENATAVTLRQAYGKENVIKRSDIKKMTSQGQSLMPEGLEAGLKPQDLADLMEYIMIADAGGK
jgi:putative membrane-bound dehydrogenase-like protein